MHSCNIHAFRRCLVECFFVMYCWMKKHAHRNLAKIRFHAVSELRPGPILWKRGQWPKRTLNFRHIHFSYLNTRLRQRWRVFAYPLVEKTRTAKTPPRMVFWQVWAFDQGVGTYTFVFRGCVCVCVCVDLKSVCAKGVNRFVGSDKGWNMVSFEGLVFNHTRCSAACTRAYNSARDIFDVHWRTQCLYLCITNLVGGKNCSFTACWAGACRSHVLSL